jgi:tRNA(Ile)-lysidine synthase
MIEERVRATGLLTPATPVTVLLSGGRDSVCLLDLALRLAGRDAVSALHVDYGLRDSAAADEAHCAELCARLEIPLEVRHPQAPDAGNLQGWARDQRYAAAAHVVLRRGGVAATGHTATDQVETVLYRLAASPGRRALLGMPARSGRLVRPLLGVTREETAAYCRARGLTWREDESNESDAFARNRIRNGLLETLRTVHPAAEANVLATLDVLRDEAAVLETVVDAALEETAGEVARLAALPPALARLAVQRLADRACGRPPAVGRRTSEILALGAGGGSAALDVGGGLRAVVEYGRLRFERNQPAAPASASGTGRGAPRAPARGTGPGAPPAPARGTGPGAPPAPARGTGPGAPPAPARGTGPGAPPAPAPLTVPGHAVWAGGELTSERASDLPVDDDPLTATLDAAALAPALDVRAWRPGDRMRPLGLGGSRSLQDLFTDRKVPRARRALTPIVLSGDEIAWVPGVATGERFRVTDATRLRVRLRWSPP